MASHLTYEYHGDEVLAMVGGKVVARGTDFAKVATTAEEYFNSLGKKRQMDEHDAARRTATHITTPNGAKGEVLNKVAGLWGDQITVRFENGQIRRFDTMAGDENLVYSRERVASAPQSMIEAYQQTLDQDYDHGVRGLTARLEQLGNVKREASTSASVSDFPSIQAYHQIVLAAEAEEQEVKEALEHLKSADVEAYMPPSFAAVEQADLGRAKSDTWLDVVAREMIAESEAEDYDKLLEEGPTELVSSLGDAAVHDAGIVREAAINLITTRTAGFQGEQIEAYREAFVAKAEQARRLDLTFRQENQRTAAAKEAAADDFPDEAMFL